VGTYNFGVRRWIALGCVVAASFGCRAPEQVVVKAPKNLCEVKDQRLTEASGLAASRIHPGIYYTHNDGGHPPDLFAFNDQGNIVGVWRVAGAENVDWEDMAVQEIGGKSRVFLADIGDNAGKRSTVQVYQVDEPTGREELRAVRYDLRYPDGPHNAEAFFVDPSGRFWIIVKTKDRAGVYVGDPTQDSVAALKRVSELEFEGPKDARLVTGAAISPDGKSVVVRTYLGCWLFAAPQNLDDWTKAKPVPIPLGLEFQGEAVTFDSAGKRILTCSEGSPCPVHETDLGN